MPPGLAKLRQCGLGTDHVTVFIHTSEHDHVEPRPSAAITVDLPEAATRHHSVDDGCSDRQA